MIREENLTLEIIRSLQLRFCGTMFGLAMYLGIWFDDAEIKYIETKMMTHPKYRLVSGRAAGGVKRGINNRLLETQEIWLMSFLDDPDIPIGVRAFIRYYIGHERAQLQISDKISGTHSYEIYKANLWLTERWMETCR